MTEQFATTDHQDSISFRIFLHQYTNLLKAQWLVQNVSDGPQQVACHPGSLYYRILKQIEQHILRQHARTDLPAWTENAILSLEPSCFAIYPGGISHEDTSEVEAPIQSEKLVEVIASTSGQMNELFTLEIYREDHQNLRLEEIRVKQDRSGRITTEVTKRFVDLSRDGLIPLYTITDAGTDNWVLNVAYGGTKTPVAYQFRSKEDAISVQQAFVEYEVRACVADLPFTGTYRGFARDRQDTMRSELQIWQWPLVEDTLRDQPQGSPTSSQSLQNSYASSTSSIVSSRFGGYSSSIITFTNVDGQAGVLSSMPPPPLLMVFSKMRNEFYIWRIECELVLSQFATMLINNSGVS